MHYDQYRPINFGDAWDLFIECLHIDYNMGIDPALGYVFYAGMWEKFIRNLHDSGTVLYHSQYLIFRNQGLEKIKDMTI